MDPNDRKKIILNIFDSENRANLLLINCNKNLIVEINNNIRISVYELISSVNLYSNSDGYQFSLSFTDLKKYVFKKIEAMEELDFENIYRTYNEEVEHIYKELIGNTQNEISEKRAKELFKNVEDLITIIIKRKYIYPKSYLNKKLNKEIYIDFISKMVFIASIKKENEKGISLEKIKQFNDRLCINKDLICNDKRLKIYEKILLLLNIYIASLLREDTYFKIKFYHIEDSQKNSPLNLCFNFLSDFADNLSETSDFFYPLLCIDSGIFKYKWIMSRQRTIYINSFGFDMSSVNRIKKHLKDLIPRVIIIDDDLGDAEATTSEYTGMIILNNSTFIKNKIDIQKDSLDKIMVLFYQKYFFMKYKVIKKVD